MKTIIIERKKEETSTGFENITQHSKPSTYKKKTHTNSGLNFEHSAKALSMIQGLKFAQGYLEYLEKHGYHFTDKLAEHVSSLMENINETDHCWTPSQVKSELVKLSIPLPDNVTIGDITYLVNMYYSDFYPNVFKEPKDSFKAAYNIANDPDGYEGMIFYRWTADLIGKRIDIDWGDFI